MGNGVATLRDRDTGIVASGVLTSGNLIEEGCAPSVGITNQGDTNRLTHRGIAIVIAHENRFYLSFI
jgi:hypothetical protein